MNQLVECIEDIQSAICCCDPLPNKESINWTKYLCCGMFRTERPFELFYLRTMSYLCCFPLFNLSEQTECHPNGSTIMTVHCCCIPCCMKYTEQSFYCRDCHQCSVVNKNQIQEHSENVIKSNYLNQTDTIVDKLKDILFQSEELKGVDETAISTESNEASESFQDTWVDCGNEFGEETSLVWAG